jgi:tetratricopeptide (TPR) repeat protein
MSTPTWTVARRVDRDSARTARRPRWLLLLALAAACATAPRPPAATSPPGAPSIRLPAEEVTVSKLDLELAGMDDEELFVVGTDAYEAKDWARAAAAFARIVDRFPGSRREATALFDAGLAYQQLGEWRLALERFQALARGWEGPDALEASFKVAECHYHLQDLPAAHAALEAIAASPSLALPDRVRVLTQLGVVELEDGRPDEAEGTLRKALAAWSSVAEAERRALDPYYAAQAEYHLGEAARGRFLALAVDPSALDDRQLAEKLEAKATLLLEAQGHYLRSIRLGDARWAVASGYRVGELYDALRTQLLEAPLPPGLDEEHAQAYRDELRRRLRVLAGKAVGAYQAAVEFATRQGVDDLRFLSDAEEALQRLRAALEEPKAM